MVNRSILWAVPLVGLLFLPAGAFASSDIGIKITCTPDTATRGSTVAASVTFKNSNSISFVLSKYAQMQHFGGLSFSGPKNNAFASPIMIPALSGVTASSTPCTPFTFGCTNVPGTASTTINFTIPVSVLPKQLVNTGFGFWGTKGTSTTKALQSAGGCSVEAQ